MNKRMLSFALVPALLSALLPAQYVQAAGTGDLIKCPDFAAVYYLADDGKRYIFPNESIFLAGSQTFLK